MGGDPGRIERVEGGKPCRWIAAFGKDDGAAELRADAIGMGNEEVIERAQGRKVEAACDPKRVARAASVRRPSASMMRSRFQRWLS